MHTHRHLHTSYTTNSLYIHSHLHISPVSYPEHFESIMGKTISLTLKGNFKPPNNNKTQKIKAYYVPCC